MTPPANAAAVAKRDWRAASLRTVVCLGESTTAGGWSTSPERCWVAQLERLQQAREESEARNEAFEADEVADKAPKLVGCVGAAEATHAATEAANEKLLATERLAEAQRAEHDEALAEPRAALDAKGRTELAAQSKVRVTDTTEGSGARNRSDRIEEVAEKMSLFVETLTPGRVITIDVTPTTTLAAAKRKILDQEGTPLDLQCLKRRGGDELNDTSTLADCGITHEDTLCLTIHTRGGMMTDDGMNDNQEGSTSEHNAHEHAAEETEEGDGPRASEDLGDGWISGNEEEEDTPRALEDSNEEGDNEDEDSDEETSGPSEDNADGLVSGTGTKQDPWDSEGDEEAQDESLEVMEEFTVNDTKIDKSNKYIFDQMFGEWIGTGECFSGAMPTIMCNTGGKMVPKDKCGYYIQGNRFNELLRLVSSGFTSMAISVESHLDDPGAEACRSWMKGKPSFQNCRVEMSATPRNGKRNKDPAGIVVVMTTEMKKRRRGDAVTKASGRLMYLRFGAGAVAAEDYPNQDIHLIIVYGVANATTSDANRELAKELYEDTDNLLRTLKGKKVILCGDINTCNEGSDRIHGKQRNSDNSAHALWRLRDVHDLVDVMDKVSEGEAPKTFVPGRLESSRVDILYCSKKMGKVQAGTAQQMGELSATHRPLGWSFPELHWQKVRAKGDVMKAVAVLRTWSRPQRLRFTPAARKNYDKVFNNTSIMERIDIMEIKLGTELERAAGKKEHRMDAYGRYFVTHAQLLVAAAEMSKNERPPEKKTGNEGKARIDLLKRKVQECARLMEDVSAFVKWAREAPDGEITELELLEGTKGQEEEEEEEEEERRHEEKRAGKMSALFSQIEVIQVLHERKMGLPPSEVREEPKIAILTQRGIENRYCRLMQVKATNKARAVREEAKLTRSVNWVQEIEQEAIVALTGAQWVWHDGQWTQPRRGEHAKQGMEDREVLEATKDPKKTHSGGAIGGWIVDGVARTQTETLHAHVREVQLGYTKIHWHARIMKDVLIQTEATPDKGTGTARTVQEVEANCSEWTTRLMKMKTGAKELRGATMTQKGVETKLAWENFMKVAEESKLEYPENLKEALQGTGAFSQERTDTVAKNHAQRWLLETEREATNIVTELEKTPSIAAHFNDQVVKNEDLVREIAEAFDEALAPPKTASDVRAMFKRMPPGKTSGYSGAAREHYLWAPDSMLEKLIPIIQLILDGDAPDITKLGVITPLPKTTTTFRPVTLLEVLLKSVTAHVSDKCFLLMEKYGLLNDNQYGFIRGGNCEDPLEIASAVLQDSRAKGKKGHAVFLDCKSAYDTVPEYALSVAFGRLGASKKFTKWATATVGNHHRVTQVRSGMSSYDSRFKTGGLAQGSPESPLFWTVVADLALSYAAKTGGKGYQLIDRLSEEDPEEVRVQQLAFADDFACFDETKEGVQRTAQAVVTILGVFNIRVSPEKCVYLWSKAAHDEVLTPKNTLAGLCITRPRTQATKVQEAAGQYGTGTVTRIKDKYAVEWEQTGATQTMTTLGTKGNDELLDMMDVDSFPILIAEVRKIPREIKISKGTGKKKWKAQVGGERADTTGTHRGVDNNELLQYMVRHQRGALGLTALAVDGRLRQTTCKPCAPIRVRNPTSLEAGGATRYLGARISFIGWGQQHGHARAMVGDFFTRMEATAPTLRQFNMLLQSLLTSSLNYSSQICPFDPAKMAQLQAKITRAVGKILGVTLNGKGRTTALVLGQAKHCLAMGVTDPTTLMTIQDIKALLKGAETANRKLAAAMQVALREGLDEEGRVKELTTTGEGTIPYREIFDTVLSRLRNLQRIGGRLHKGGGEALTSTPKAGRRIPPGPEGKYQLEAAEEAKKQFDADAKIAILPTDYVFVPMMKGRDLSALTQGQRVVEGSVDVFAAIGMVLEKDQEMDIWIIDTQKEQGQLRCIPLYHPEGRKESNIPKGSKYDHRCAMRASVLLTTKQQGTLDADIAKDWINQEERAQREEQRRPGEVDRDEEARVQTEAQQLASHQKQRSETNRLQARATLEKRQSIPVTNDTRLQIEENKQKAIARQQRKSTRTAVANAAVTVAIAIGVATTVATAVATAVDTAVAEDTGNEGDVEEASGEEAALEETAEDEAAADETKTDSPMLLDLPEDMLRPPALLDLLREARVETIGWGSIKWVGKKAPKITAETTRILGDKGDPPHDGEPSAKEAQAGVICEDCRNHDPHLGSTPSCGKTVLGRRRDVRTL